MDWIVPRRRFVGVGNVGAAAQKPAPASNQQPSTIEIVTEEPVTVVTLTIETPGPASVHVREVGVPEH